MCPSLRRLAAQGRKGEAADSGKGRWREEQRQAIGASGNVPERTWAGRLVAKAEDAVLRLAVHAATCPRPRDTPPLPVTHLRDNLMGSVAVRRRLEGHLSSPHDKFQQGFVDPLPDCELSGCWSLQGR